MASDKQKELFDNLLSQKQFPAGTDLDALRSQFANVDTASGSEWIEKAMALPDKDRTPPPF